MSPSFIRDLLQILAAGLAAGLLSRWFKAPVLIGYLLVGALIGHGALGWVQDEGHQLEYFAEAGVFLLLFSIGIEFSLDDLRRLGKDLFVGGTVQMALVAVPVSCLLKLFGSSWPTSILIGAAISFSSTVLVFKTLSQWGQTQQPHGQRAVGILLFQDAALVPLLLLVPLLTNQGEAVTIQSYLRLAFTSGLFVCSIWLLRKLLARWLIPGLAAFRSPELVILFTIVVLGAVTLVAYEIGLPPAVGAFAAGLIFNGNRWTNQIDALILPFRETFAAIFFVGLGLIFDPRLYLEQPGLMLGSLLGVIMIKAVAATIALKLTGMRWLSSVGMGIGLAHVGEFAFVLSLIGVEANVLSTKEYQQVVGLAVGSLILTPILMKLGLRFLRDEDEAESQIAPNDAKILSEQKATVIGAGPIGRRVTSQLETLGKDVCLVDLSPVNLQPFAQEGFRTVAGDAGDLSILKLAEVEESSLVVVSVPVDEIALRVVRSVRKLNPNCLVFVRCRYQSSSSKLRQAGAERVISEEAVASVALLKELQAALSL